MSLTDLIKCAAEKSPQFTAKYNYWLRKKKNGHPDIEWTMDQLEKILGKEFVENAAQEEIERQEAELYGEKL